MSADTAAEFCRSAVYLAVTIAGPVFLAMLATGLVVSFLQAATQMHEQVLNFIPKLVVAGIVILMLLPWGLGRLSEYATDLIHEIPFIVSSREN